MAACIKTCCFINYALSTGDLIARHVLGKRIPKLRSDSIEVEKTEGVLKAHVDRIARELKMKRGVSLIELPNDGMDDNRMISFIYLSLSSFGQSLCGGARGTPAGVTYRRSEAFSEDALKFFLARQVVKLKMNSDLRGKILFLIAAIASTILLLPVFPIAAYFIGPFAGQAAMSINDWLSEKKIDQTAMKLSTPQERQAALDALEDMKRQLNQPGTRNTHKLLKIDQRIHHLKNFRPQQPQD